MQRQRKISQQILLLFTIFIFTTQLCGCIASAVVGGAAIVGTSMHDRRSFGQQADDEAWELKTLQVIPQKYHDNSHFNITAYNGNILITGETPNSASAEGIIAAVKTMPNVKRIYNELRIAPLSSLSSRSNDSFITSKVKAKLVDTKQVSTNHIKVVTENAEVFLMGLVTQNEATAAIEATRRVGGVRKVINLLEILSADKVRKYDINSHLEDEKNRPVRNHNNYYYLD